MSTLKSNAEDLVLNADGSSSEVKLQINGVEKGSISDDGLEITGSSPQLKLTDSDSGADDFWLHANSDCFYVLTDRNDDGDFVDSDEWAPPLILANATQDALLYGDTVATQAWVSANAGGGGVEYAEFISENSTNTTFTVPSSATKVRITAVGAGGGGGGSPRYNNNRVAGGGGGSGGVAMSRILNVTGGTTYNISVGAGGNGGTSSGSWNSNSGNSGGATSFGNLLTVNGGGGGGGHQGNSGYGGAGGSGGTASGGSGGRIASGQAGTQVYTGNNANPDGGSGPTYIDLDDLGSGGDGHAENGGYGTYGTGYTGSSGFIHIEVVG